MGRTHLKRAESIQNTIDECRIRPGETVPVFDFAKLAASLIDQTLIGYTDFLTFVECGTRLDISLGQSWKVGCEAPLEDQVLTISKIVENSI